MIANRMTSGMSAAVTSSRFSGGAIVAIWRPSSASRIALAGGGATARSIGAASSPPMKVPVPTTRASTPTSSVRATSRVRRRRRRRFAAC
jgi:hypothetical protein